MPFYFTCPGCQRKNYGYKLAPEGERYFPDMMCNQCGLKGISWVASQSTALKLTTPLKLIAVGAGKSTIPYMDPSVATGSTETVVVPRLKPVAKIVSPYSQGARSAAFTPTIKAVGEGQCAGQCLHWIRRVLQGGRESYEVLVQKKGLKIRTDAERVKKQKKQHLIGAQTQVMLSRHKDSTSRLNELDEKMRQLLRSKGVPSDGDPHKFSTVPQERARQTTIYNALMDKRNAIVDRWDAKGFYDYGWKELAKELDAVVNKRLGGSSRPFSNILAVRCFNRTSKQFQSGTASDFAHAVTSDAEFRPSRAVILSVGLLVASGEKGGQISGHAIAGHCKSPSEIYLFDPNHGIFHCSSRENFRKALEILMGDAWSASNWQLDGTFGYAFFRSASAMTEKRQVERHVDYTAHSCPGTLAAHNKALGTVPNPIKSTSSAPPSRTPPKAAMQKFAPQGSPKMVVPEKKGAGRIADLAKKFGGK